MGCYDQRMEQRGTNIMEYVQVLESMVRQYRTEDRVFRGGSFLLGLLAGVVGTILARLVLR